LVVFVLVRIVPGDPARLMLGMEASEEAVQAARAQFGFDRPLYIQYVQFVGGALRGDLGQSVRFRRPVGDLLRESFPATLELALLTRSNMLDVLREQYVRTARAKGLRETVIVHKHALMSAALPIVTVLGLQVGALLSGAVVTETVFNWPGIGTLALRAIQQRD